MEFVDRRSARLPVGPVTKEVDQKGEAIVVLERIGRHGRSPAGPRLYGLEGVNMILRSSELEGCNHRA